jgi:hypothetical protein
MTDTRKAKNSADKSKNEPSDAALAKNKNITNQPGLPPNLTIEETPDLLVIRRRWLNSDVWILTLMTVVFGSVLILAYWGTATSARDTLMLIMLTLPFAACFTALGYYCVVTLVNHSIVTADGYTLTIAHGPLPAVWTISKRTIAASEIDELQVRAGNVQVNKLPRFVVCATRLDGSQEILFAGFEQKQHATFVRDLLRKHLLLGGIQVPAAPGEATMLNAAVSKSKHDHP